MSLLFKQNTYIFCLLFGLFLNSSVTANKILVPAAPNIAAKSYILMDFNSGKILAEKNSNVRLESASLTKIMTAYVVFQELKNGNLNLSDKVTISKKAWKAPGSRMFANLNAQITVEDLLQGVIVQSGNDASIALAEHIAGDEAIFSAMMNQQAKRLGMIDSNFKNSSGLPHPDHYTTAADMARLAVEVIAKFPIYYRWDSQKEFTHNGITQRNRNKLLWRDKSVDGIKTGYTKGAGYCMVASAKREQMRLITVVMNAASANARADTSLSLLNYGFRFFATHKLYQAHKILATPRVWQGTEPTIPLVLKSDLYVTIPSRYYQDLKAEIKLDKQVIAPIKQDEKLGAVFVSLGDEVIASMPLVALKTLPQGGFVRRLYDITLLWLERFQN